MLPRSKRVSKELFPSIVKTGRVFHTLFFSLRYVKTNNEIKASFVVSKKVAKTAVQRNKIRRVWAFAIKNLILGKQGVYVFFLKKEATTLKFKEIQGAIRNIL